MHITLPIGLKQKIDEAVINISGRQSTLLNNSYRFYYSLLRDSMNFKGLPCINVDYTADKVRSLLGRNYLGLLESFEQNNILTIDKKTIVGKKSKSYGFDPSYLDEAFTTFEIIENLPDCACAATSKILLHCQINEIDARESIERHIRTKGIFKDLKVNDEIDTDFFKNIYVHSVRSSRGKYLDKIYRNKLLSDFYTDGFSLIQLKKNNYYMPLEYYKEMRRRGVRWSYYNSLTRFLNNDIRVTRDDKANRLHSNVTNMPSLLVRKITYNNENLLEIDLANSQWSMLVYCLTNPELDNIISNGLSEFEFNFNSLDFLEFKEMTSRGELYEWVQHKLSLTTRQDAKNMMFETLFGNRRESTAKLRIKSLIPEVFNYLKHLKSKYSYKEIPITLQNVESSIFIDNLLSKLHREDVPAISKHDAIIIPESYFEEANKLVHEVLDLTLENYKTKTEFYSIKKKRAGTMGLID